MLPVGGLKGSETLKVVVGMRPDKLPPGIELAVRDGFWNSELLIARAAVDGGIRVLLCAAGANHGNLR